MNEFHSDSLASGALDLATWELLFQATQVPLYIEDITTVRPLIKDAYEKAGPAQFSNWLDGHPEFVGLVISRIKILYANQAAVDQVGATSQDELLVSLEKLVLPETLTAFKEFICVIAEDRRIYQGDCRYRKFDGSEFQTHNRGWIPAVDDPRQLLVLATFDVTDLQEARQALAESEERYRLLIETARDVIMRHDLAGRITFVNQAGVDMLGVPHEKIIGLATADLLTPQAYSEARERLDARMAGDDGLFLYETEFVRSDGKSIPLEVSSTLLPVPANGSGEPQILLVARDISLRQEAQRDQQKLEARLRDAQKRESLGVLAGGIAHDFNNLLATILGNAELLGEEPSSAGEQQQVCLDAITEAGELAAELCRQMQAYAGAAPTRVEALDLSQVIVDIKHLVQVSISGGSHVHYELARDLPLALIDPAQVRQVIMGMVANAAEAFGPDGGEVMIRTGERELGSADKKPWSAGAELVPGRYVFCEVRDSGCGMDAETKSRLFDPFYSTKFAGRGLGMAAGLGIIKSHGGAFVVESQLDQGTEISFWLPVHAAAIKQDRRAKPEPAINYDVKGRTILLVDDDPRVRAVAESFLRRLGCHVLSAADGFDAVRAFGQRHDEIDAIILDYTMPGMDGAGTSRRLRVIRPTVPLLISSGHDEAGVLAKSGDLGMSGFVAKPYNLRQLNEALALALNKPAM